MRVSYTIVFVHDMDRAVRFYRDAVGFPLRFQSPDWSEFDSEGSTLALHGSASQGPEAALEPVPGTCRPGFSVPDLDEFHRRMVAQQVPCVQAPTTVFGARLAQYRDPDGLVFSVGQQRL